MIPISAVSSRMHTKARCAGCGTLSVVQPSAVARIVSALVVHASAQPSIGAAAQPAVPADRFAHKIVGFWEAVPALAAAERQTVGRLSTVQLSRSSTRLSGAVAHECRAVAIERIERGLKARGAACDSMQRCLNPGADDGPLCHVWYRQRGSTERRCPYRVNARVTCLTSAFYRRYRPTRRCS